VTRPATHVFSVVFSAGPLEVCSIPPVTHQARFICLRRSGIGWGIRRFTLFGSRTRFSVFFAITMAGLAPGGTCVFQELGAFTVSIKCKGLHDEPVALKTVFPYNFTLSRSYA
jgi:hypothetical protein